MSSSGKKKGPIQDAGDKLRELGLAIGHFLSSAFCVLFLFAAFREFGVAYYKFWSDSDSLPTVLYKLTGGIELLFFAPIPLLFMFAILRAGKNVDEKALINLKVSVAALLSAIVAASLTGTILQSPEEYILVGIKGGALIVLALYTFIMSVSLKEHGG